MQFFLHFRPEGHREPRNEVASLTPAERLVGFEPGTFQFLLQRLNPLGHSPQNFWTFLPLNCSNFSLKQSERPQSYQKWQRN